MQRKIFGRKNGGICENGVIDQLEREAAAAGTVVAMAVTAMVVAAVSKKAIMVAVIMWNLVGGEEIK